MIAYEIDRGMLDRPDRLELYRAVLAQPDDYSRRKAMIGLQEFLSQKTDETALNMLGGAIQPTEEYAIQKAKTEGVRASKVQAFHFAWYEYQKTGLKAQIFSAENIAMELYASICRGENWGLKRAIPAVVQSLKGRGLEGSQSNAPNLKKRWATYRGVAHLGAAMHLAGVNDRPRDIFRGAENIRHLLNTEKPEAKNPNDQVPYVPSGEQIAFFLPKS